MKKHAIRIIIAISVVVIGSIILWGFENQESDKKFSSREEFVEKVSADECTVFFKEQDGFFAVVQKDRRNTEKASFGYSLGEETYILDHMPFQRNHCQRVVSQKVDYPVQSKLDIVFLNVIRCHGKNLFFFTILLHPDSSTLRITDVKEERSVLIDPPAGELGAFSYVFFVQDASEMPIFSINDVTYRVERKKLIRME